MLLHVVELDLSYWTILPASVLPEPEQVRQHVRAAARQALAEI